ncbi:MAG: hypothetical protein IJ774_10170 [Selenomonadaceae bacterium]|nr:hypothetical protein [Selenomonadaceae bacterium]
MTAGLSTSIVVTHDGTFDGCGRRFDCRYARRALLTVAVVDSIVVTHDGHF